MGEGLFRGVVLPHFTRIIVPQQANLLQAGLFALWHLVWPVKDMVSGRADLASAAGQAVMLLAATAIGGYVFDFLYLQTGSLWAPWLSHTIHNSVLNLLNIRTMTG